MRRKAYLALAVLLSLGLSGCGPKVVYKYRIAVIPKGLTHEFWQSIERGARRAGADLTEQGVAVEVLWDGPLKEGDSKEQIDLVQAKSGMGIHGLVLAPQHSEGMVPVVRQTVEKNIPVVVIDSGLAAPDLMVKYIATDNKNGGRLGAKRLLEVLAKEEKKAPKLVLFRYAVGSESTEEREKGFVEYVQEVAEKQRQAGEPAVEIISDDKYAGDTVEKAEKVAGPLLRQFHDKADGIFAVNESSTMGLLNAMRAQGLLKKIHVVGFDASKELLQAVEEGDVDGLVVQDPYRMGYLGVWVLVQHLEGYDVSAGGKDLSTGENMVTRDNLKDEKTRQLFDKDVQKKRSLELPKFKKK
jgi:ribose transport system substrate-binding protein